MHSNLDPYWMSKAVSLVFDEFTRKKEITSEDVLPKLAVPADLNPKQAWNYVFRRLSQNKAIVRVGAKLSDIPKKHQAWVRVWRKAELRK
jgi:hypothetical protein